MTNIFQVTAENLTAAIVKKHSKLFGTGSPREVYECKILELIEYAMVHHETIAATTRKHDGSSATDHNDDSTNKSTTAAAPATFVFKKVTVNSDPNEILNMDLNTVSDVSFPPYISHL